MGFRCILFVFDNEEDKMWVIDNKTWYLYQKALLALTHWKPFFDSLTSVLESRPVRFKLPRLPIEFWTFQNVAGVIADAGKLLVVDYVTESKTKLEFVIGMAEVNLNWPLVQEITLESSEGIHRQFINYDFLAEACFICGDLAYRCQYCPYSIHQRQLYLECTSTQRLRKEGVHPIPLKAPTIMFSTWVPVNPIVPGKMVGLLSIRMEKMGISDNSMEVKSGINTLQRKPLVRFVVKPSNEEVVAEYVDYNSQTKTRAMATTAIPTKVTSMRSNSATQGSEGTDVVAKLDGYGSRSMQATLTFQCLFLESLNSMVLTLSRLEWILWE